MKALLLTLALLPSLARADVQSVIQRLDSAQAQLQGAQAQIDAARAELYQMLQGQAPGYVCVYSYFSKTYTAGGATEKEATDNVVFQCARDPQNSGMAGDCQYRAHINGNVQCRTVNH